MTLRQQLDEIILLSDDETPPTITPCWEWIAEAFKKTASQEKVLKDIVIGIYEDRYEITVDDETVDEGDFPFSPDEVKDCEKIASYNFISISQDMMCFFIRFTYRVI